MPLPNPPSAERSAHLPQGAPRPPSPWAVGIVLALWGLVTCLLAARLAGETVDDFFITFRYSQNLLAGEGFVFNPGERVFGTTAPGWGLLLAALSRLTGLAPAVAATLTSALALLFTAVWLLRESAARERFWEAALAGSLMLTSSFLWVHNGSEAFAATALLVLAAGLIGKRPAAAGGLAGLAVWMRPEAGLAGLLLGFLAGWRERRLPWRFGAAFGLVVVAGLAWAALYFGRPLPSTLHAKQVQAAWKPEVWAGGVAFWKEGWRWLSAAYAGPWVGVLVAGGGAGLISLARSGVRALVLLAAYALALFLAYPLLRVPFYTWYAIPFLVALLYGLAFLAGDLWNLARQLGSRPGSRPGSHLGSLPGPRPGSVLDSLPGSHLASRLSSRLGLREGSRLTGPARPVAVAALALLLVPVALFAFHVSRRTLEGYRGFQAIPQTELYRETGEWLRRSSPPEADVAYVEVGALAYYSDRPVRDLLGLVSPENLPYVEAHDLAAALRARPTTFVAHHTRLAGLMDPVLHQPWFTTTYQPVKTFEAKLSDGVLTLYRRREGGG